MVRQLGELENDIMTRVWQWNRPVTVREVLLDLQAERDIAYTTVMTVLDKLFRKGWLRRDQVGRAYRYEPVSSREAYTAALMNDAWGTSDNPAAALVHFFGLMSPEQREALRDALRVAALFPAPADPGPGPAGTETDTPGEADTTGETPPDTGGHSRAHSGGQSGTDSGGPGTPP
ncbi:BlaI/MecI/CopY family transcriptional regulator [Kitasatospora herbaricolor]|uniref:BlaI/MecI/CopY family transcriptional regulator n=1 Tax=Kitasatospora herbaricolor TaxID=68217 RepID=UPI00174A2764|nr:BlaI/MecI/CopY family transcriptional regulator [Kitasatospora herbaricolor]